MRLLKSLALGLLGLATSVAAQDDAASVAVELDRATFKNFIEQNTVVLTDCKFFFLERNANPDGELTANFLLQSTQYVSFMAPQLLCLLTMGSHLLPKCHQLLTLSFFQLAMVWPLSKVRPEV